MMNTPRAYSPVPGPPVNPAPLVMLQPEDYDRAKRVTADPDDLAAIVRWFGSRPSSDSDSTLRMHYWLREGTRLFAQLDVWGDARPTPPSDLSASPNSGEPHRD